MNVQRENWLQLLWGKVSENQEGPTGCKRRVSNISQIINYIENKKQRIPYHVHRSKNARKVYKLYIISLLITFFPGNNQLVDVSIVLKQISCVCSRNRMWMYQDVVLVYWVSVSSAFDTIDHTLFLKRFQHRYEIGKSAPQWFSSLSSWSYVVRRS